MKQKLLKLMCLLCVSVIGMSAWGETTTYQHVFTAKPATGNNKTLSGVAWNIAATNLNGYNSDYYAGVQIGSSKTNGSITLTSASDWNYNSKAKITEVRLWLNLGGTSVTPTVTIGGKSATSDGTTVVKNSSAGTDWTKATKVTFTPAADGNTGVVVINVATVKAGYICAMEIDCEEASSEPTVSFSVSSKTLLVGQSFTQEATASDITGSVVYQSSNTGVATVNSTTGEVTAVAGGNATITASVAADGIEASYIVTVVEKEDGIYNFTWDLSTKNYSTGENIVEWTNEFAEMTNSGNLATNYLGGDSNNRTSSRFYTNNNLTITPATAVSNIYTITSIEFTATTDGYATTLANSKWTNAVAVVDETKVTVVPIDGTDEISAIIGGTCGFTAVKVYYNATYTRTVTSGNWGTLCLPYAATVEGATLYSITDKDASGITVTEAGTTAAAGVPYIFKATATQLVATYTGTAYTPAGTANGLYGTYSDIDFADVAGYTDGDYYVVLPSKVQAASVNSGVDAYRAYIVLGEITSSPGVKGIRLGFDEATAITELTESTEKTEGTEGIYNLNGQRLNGVQKGINIVNGKKVLVK